MKKIDATGKNCPIPVIEAKKALEEVEEGITISVDNDVAVSNLKKLATSLSYTADDKKLSDNLFEVTITKQNANLATNEDVYIAKKEKITTVVIDANTMGKGDETLGKTLIKGFIFALSSRDAIPNNIIFYNSGAFIPCTDSESLDDLKVLEEKGVNIITCGACLDFYNLKEELKVGNISNMYDILETMATSDLIIKP